MIESPERHVDNVWPLLKLRLDRTAGGSSPGYGQTLIVAKSGGDYSSIQDAIDAITAASEAEPWAVIVFPGVYAEDVTLKAWVAVVGVDREAVVISGDAGAGSPQVLVTGAANAALGHLTIKKTVVDSRVLAGILAPAAGELYVSAVRVELTTAAVSAATLKAVSANGDGGAVRMFGCWLLAELDAGATGSAAYGAHVPDTGGDLYLYHCPNIYGSTYDLHNLAS
ncbi:MAG: hypothetical protein JXA37_03575 [Chloroflexia bacterium]|nr:hypothetical protein [Chloroflexia bacterium]